MMLKNESKKWARLKLLMVLPLVALAVYAFARPAMNPLPDTSTDKSTEILTEMSNVPYYLGVQEDDPDEKEDEWQMVVMSKTGDDGKLEYALPVAYNSEKKRDEIKTYVVGDESYTMDEFFSKFTGYFVVRYEKNLPNVDQANVISLKCKTQSGLTTPVWYLVKGTEMVRDEAGATKTYEEIYRVRRNKEFEKDHGVPASVQDKRQKNVRMSFLPPTPFLDGKRLYRFPLTYNENRIRTYTIGDKLYNMNEFEKISAGYITVFDEKDLYDANRANVISFRCETQSGETTPTWYLVKGTEMVRDEAGATKTYEEIYRARQKKEVEEVHSTSVQGQTPDNYHPAYYTMNGKRMTNAEYNKLKENSIALVDPHYVPFAKGEVVKVQGVFITGLQSSVYLREMYVNGKAPDRSHVYLVVDGKKEGFDGVHYKYPGETFSNRADAEKQVKEQGTGKVIECRFVTKDGSKSSEVWYTAFFKFSPPSSANRS